MASTSDSSSNQTQPSSTASSISPSEVIPSMFSVYFGIPFKIYKNAAYISTSVEDFTQYMAIAILQRQDFEVIREEMEKRGKRKTLTQEQIGLICKRMATSDSFSKLRACVNYWMRVEKKYNDDLFIFHETNRIVEYINNLLKKKFKIQEEPLPGLSKKRRRI